MVSCMEIVVGAKRLGVESARACCRSVKEHPFLVGFVLFSVFLYRSFPFLFSVLLSASPVLVCTAVLLGTLLSLGQPNIPEIEKDEEKINDDVVSLRTGVSVNQSFVVERESDESFVVERYVRDRGELVDTSIGDDAKLKNGVESPDRVPLIDGTLWEIHAEGLVASEVEREFREFEFEKKREIAEDEGGVKEGVFDDGKIGENQYSLIQDVDDDEIFSAEGGKFDRESVRAFKDDHNGDDDDDEEEDDDDDGSSYSDSDGAESSSPDASMADIIPMLDELHPLLDLEAPQPAHRDESDAGSEHSHRSDETNPEADNHGDDEHEGKEDESKSAIKWTEDDQKNLMDLGTLELERNQRLENLILRRRARKSFRLVADKNLIDLDSADLPFNVPPISTARQNPFDFPDDSYDLMGLPPIPGSAPSVLVPRRNPFDLPYDSNEEKPDLKGDNFEQEFLTIHQKESLFRRHESFSLGPSGLGGSRHHDRHWKPVFVPETSYSSFQRQLSEVSESKLSSVPDTDSVISVSDADEKRLHEKDFSKEIELLSDLVECKSQSSEEYNDSEEMEQDQEMGFGREEDEVSLGDVKNHVQMGFGVSEMKLAATHVKHGSQPSEDDEDDDSEEMVRDEQKRFDLEADETTLGKVESHDETEFGVSEGRLETVPGEKEGDSSSESSRSSSSEVDERIADVGNEGDDLVDEFFVSSQPSHEDTQIEEPVYDSSPHAAEKLLSLSSFSSDTHVEIPEMTRSPISDVEEDEAIVISREVTESRAIDASEVASLGVYHENNDQSESVVPESEDAGFSVISRSLSLEIQAKQETEMDSEVIENESCSKDVSVSREITEYEEIDVSKAPSSEAGQETYSQSESLMPESAVVNPNQSESVGLESENVGVSIRSRSLSMEYQANEETEMHSEIVENYRSMDLITTQEITESKVTDNSKTASSEVVQENNDVGEAVVPESGLGHISDLVVENREKDEESNTSDQENILHTVVSNAPISSEDQTIATEVESLENWELVPEEIIHLEEHRAQSDPLSEVTSIEEDGLVHPENDDHAPFSALDSEILVESSVLEGASVENEPEKENLLIEEEAGHSDHELASSSRVHDSQLKMESSSSDDESLPSESPTKLEKDLSLSEKAVAETCEDKHSGIHEPTTTMEEIKDDNTVPTVGKDCAVSSIHTSDAASLPIENIDYEPLAQEFNMESRIFGGILENSNSQVLDLESHIGEENIKEEVDEIKDYDEELLMELDAVGDFRINEVGDTENESSKPKELIPEMPILETRVFDIDLALKQLHHGSSDVEEVKDHSENMPETDPNLKTVEPKSSEDIHDDVNIVSEGTIHVLPTSSNSTAESSEVVVLHKANLSSQFESVSEEASPVLPDEDKHKSSRSLEDSNPSKSDKGDKKSDDQIERSSSSCSSSSSSSSSDSK